MTDYRRIRVLWPDHLALARGKYLPTHLAHRGTRHSMSVFALLYDRDMIPAPGTRMLEGFPDMECTIDTSAIRDGWEEGVGVVVGDLVSDGAPVSFAPRNALREAVAAWEALGYTPKIGIEFEAFVLQRDDEGGWEPYDCPGSYVYGTGPMSDPMGIAEAIHDVADAVGFRLESVNGEFDSAQFEFTLEYDDAMAYMNLLHRERADLQPDAGEYKKDTEIADGWVQKTLETKKIKNARAEAKAAAGQITSEGQ